MRHEYTTRVAGVEFEVRDAGVGIDRFGVYARVGDPLDPGDSNSPRAAVHVADFETSVQVEGLLTIDPVSNLCDAAMSLWEAVVCAPSDMVERVDSIRRREGTAALRLAVAWMARPCHVAWVIAHRDGRGYDDAFDWEFCPRFVRECLRWDRHEGVSLRRDWPQWSARLGGADVRCWED